MSEALSKKYFSSIRTELYGTSGKPDKLVRGILVTPVGRAETVCRPDFILHTQFAMINTKAKLNTFKELLAGDSRCVLTRLVLEDIGVEVWWNTTGDDQRVCPLKYIYLALGSARGPVILYSTRGDLPRELALSLQERIRRLAAPPSRLPDAPLQPVSASAQPRPPVAQEESRSRSSSSMMYTVSYSNHSSSSSSSLDGHPSGSPEITRVRKLPDGGGEDSSPLQDEGSPIDPQEVPDEEEEDVTDEPVKPVLRRSKRRRRKA